MSTDKQGCFVQFPLCLLASDWKLAEVMEHSLDYSARLLVEKWEKAGEFEDEDEATRYVRAARTVNFNYRDAAPVVWRKNILVSAERVRQVQEAHERIFGPSNTFVRMPTSYAFEIRAGQWKDAEARVYCALASMIGVQKPYARAGWGVIAMRAAGFVKAPPPTRPLLTRPQVEYQLRRLQERNLFACYTLKRGVRYWSFPEKCSREQMARYVLQKHLARNRQLAETDAELTARITAELVGKKGNATV